jgi:hypothetical protein
VIEDLDSRAALRRSKRIVGKHFWRVSALTMLAVGVGLLVGPLIGAFILLGTQVPVLLANLIGLTLTAALMPLIGIAITLLFFDLRTRERV